jgi:hypothetical protein
LFCASPNAHADAYDAAFAHAIAAKERALDKNDPAAWEEALERFRRADKLRPTKECKYELGQAAARIQQHDLAFEAFESALSLGLDGSAADKARQFVSEHADSVGRLNILGPDRTEVRIAGRLRAHLPLSRPLVVFAGNSNVELSLGEQRVSRTAVVSAKSETFLDVRLAFAASAPKPPVPKPAKVEPPPDPPPVTKPDTRVAPWLLGVGIGVAAAGAVTVVLSSVTISGRRDDLASHCEIQDGSDGCRFATPALQGSAQSDVDALATWKAVRIAGWAGVGVGVGLGALGLLLPGSSADAPQTALSLHVTPRGLGASGTF